MFARTLPLLLACAVLCAYQGPAPVKGDAAHYALDRQWPSLPDSLVLGDPTGIDVDEAGHLWVFCRRGRQWLGDGMPQTPIADNTVLEVDGSSGRLIRSWGAGLFIMPHGLTVDARGRVWLTDVGLHQVFCFNPAGEMLLELGEARVPGNDSAHFNMPTDVAVCPDGSFYVADGYGNSRVLKFDSAGRFLSTWGSHGTAEGQFDIPHAIDLDSTGNVYVADRGNRRVQEFDANGRFLCAWTDSAMADLYAVTIDPRSNDAVAVDYLKRDTTVLGSDVWLLAAKGGIRAHFGRTVGYQGTPGRYHDVAMDREGNIFVGDILGDRLQKWVPTRKN